MEGRYFLDNSTAPHPYLIHIRVVDIEYNCKIGICDRLETRVFMWGGGYILGWERGVGIAGYTLICLKFAIYQNSIRHNFTTMRVKARSH